MSYSLMKFPKLSLFLLIAAVLVGCTKLGANDPESTYAPKRGDVIFQSFPSSPLVDMIEGSTNSAYSHCGIVFDRDGEWYVIEAIGPVREIPLERWLRNGEKYGFAAYRLKSSYTAQIDTFIQEAQAYLGLPYDIRYRMDDQNIYCSELVYKAFLSATGEELGVIDTLSQLDWGPHKQLIHQLENGGDIPLDREIITPVAVARAKQLDFVFSRDIEVPSRDD